MSSDGHRVVTVKAEDPFAVRESPRHGGLMRRDMFVDAPNDMQIVIDDLHGADLSLFAVAGRGRGGGRPGE
ncbi:hypothetical protein [Planotetraspora phitsanulokensis]|uniref:hypothetical protein n=1 Tax=Planotetraspora phitsanulokensis TaxID=575192 RepID=UPI00194E376E|nr:hypothetical protein [Planotetraspora phitsanulokensis]